jgi:hypothetical protein
VLTEITPRHLTLAFTQTNVVPRELRPNHGKGCADLHPLRSLSRRRAALSRLVRFPGQFVQKLLSYSSALHPKSAPLHLTFPRVFSSVLVKAPSCFERQLVCGRDVFDLAIRFRNALARIMGREVLNKTTTRQRRRSFNRPSRGRNWKQATRTNVVPREPRLSRQRLRKSAQPLVLCFRFASLFLPRQAPIAEHGPSYIIRDIKTGLNIPDFARLGIGQRGLLSTFPR